MAAIVPGQGGSSTTDHTALSNIGTNTHAQIDTAIGTIFSKVGDTLTGTAGSGFFGAIPQSSAPSTPGSGFRIYANASGLLEWKGTNGFTQTFDGSANTANRAYTLPNSSGTIAVEGSLTTFANPSIQNGCYQIIQTTAPTQRSSGVSLVAGDRWYKKDDGTEWFWNGTYWLSSMIYRLGSPVGAGNQGVTVNTGSYLTRSYLDMPATVEISYSNPIFFTEWVIELRTLSLIHDSTNYFSVEPGVMFTGGGTIPPFSVDTKAIGGGSLVYKVPLNTYASDQSVFGSYSIQRLWLQGFGTAPGFRITSTLNYRIVAT